MLTRTTWLAAIGILGGTSVVSADGYQSDSADTERPSMYSYAWSEPAMYSRIGVGLTVGGGVSGFTDQSVRNTTDSQVGGLWSARGTIGTHIPIGLDLAYNGTAVNITPLAGGATGHLVGTNAEAALRYNVLPHYMWDPYVFAGIGWQRYDITNANFSMADTGLSDKENLAVFPLGAGITYRNRSGLVFDVRGTIRPAQSSTLLREPSGGYASLHTWDAGGNVGYEF